MSKVVSVKRLQIPFLCTHFRTIEQRAAFLPHQLGLRRKKGAAPEEGAFGQADSPYRIGKTFAESRRSRTARCVGSSGRKPATTHSGASSAPSRFRCCHGARRKSANLSVWSSSPIRDSVNTCDQKPRSSVEVAFATFALFASVFIWVALEKD